MAMIPPRAMLAALTWYTTAVAAELPAEPATETAVPITGALLNPRAPLYELVAQNPVINPTAFSLVTDRYVTRYSENLYGLPAVFLGISTRIGFTGRLEYFLQGKIGYASKGGTVPVA